MVSYYLRTPTALLPLNRLAAFRIVAFDEAHPPGEEIPVCWLCAQPAAILNDEYVLNFDSKLIRLCPFHSVRSAEAALSRLLDIITADDPFQHPHVRRIVGVATAVPAHGVISIDDLANERPQLQDVETGRELRPIMVEPGWPSTQDNPVDEGPGLAEDTDGGRPASTITEDDIRRIMLDRMMQQGPSIRPILRSQDPPLPERRYAAHAVIAELEAARRAAAHSANQHAYRQFQERFAHLQSRGQLGQQQVQPVGQPVRQEIGADFMRDWAGEQREAIDSLRQSYQQAMSQPNAGMRPADAPPSRDGG